MNKRFEEGTIRNVLQSMEKLVGKSLTIKEKESLIKGAEEIDLVNSGLEETMISAYHDIRLIYKRSKSIEDLRTAGFVDAINKVGESYKSLGIFP